MWGDRVSLVRNDVKPTKVTFKEVIVTAVIKKVFLKRTSLAMDLSLQSPLELPLGKGHSEEHLLRERGWCRIMIIYAGSRTKHWNFCTATF